MLVSSIVGKGIYASKAAYRVTDERGRVTDKWELKLDVPGRAKVILYNQDQLRDLRFKVLRNGSIPTESDNLLITRESDSATVVLPSPARGVFTERSGYRNEKACPRSICSLPLGACARRQGTRHDGKPFIRDTLKDAYRIDETIDFDVLSTSRE